MRCSSRRSFDMPMKQVASQSVRERVCKARQARSFRSNVQQRQATPEELAAGGRKLIPLKCFSRPCSATMIDNVERDSFGIIQLVLLWFLGARMCSPPWQGATSKKGLGKVGQRAHSCDGTAFSYDCHSSPLDFSASNGTKRTSCGSKRSEWASATYYKQDFICPTLRC